MGLHLRPPHQEILSSASTQKGRPPGRWLNTGRVASVDGLANAPSSGRSFGRFLVGGSQTDGILKALRWLPTRSTLTTFRPGATTRAICRGAGVMTDADAFPVLRKPPVVEVICGVQFKPLDIDGMVLGIYWDRRREEFPSRQLQPAISEGVGFVLGSPPQRAILVGLDKVHVLQLQNDRFFMNWRAVGRSYPRFSSHEGRPGLMAQAIVEFRQFADFAEERCGRRPAAIKVELAKIDMIPRGQYWADQNDLATVMNITGTFGAPGKNNTREFAIRFVENDPPTELVVAVASVSERTGEQYNAIRVETRAVTPVVDGNLESAYRIANSAVNHAFFRLFTPSGIGRFEPEQQGGLP